MNATVTKNWTMDDIRTANKVRGFHFFDRDSMRFFNSRVLEDTYQGKGGIYFVTSEQFVPFAGKPHPRSYTVRTFNPETGSVGTAGKFNGLSSYMAKKQAAHFARYGMPVDSAE